jgi:hypothetical protein
MSTLYREPSIVASYQVSVHLAAGFQRRRLKYEKLKDNRRRTPSDGKKWWAKNALTLDGKKVKNLKFSQSLATFM